MKKIIFIDVPMRELFENSKQCYANTGNTICKHNEKVLFPINAVLADKLKNNDDVKIILLVTVSENNCSENNIQKFKDELNKINENIHANISYEVIKSEFVETKNIHEKRMHFDIFIMILFIKRCIHQLLYILSCRQKKREY